MTSDLLRRAADRVEQRAADCPTNPTDYRDLCAWLQRGRTVPTVTARWWATMGPEVAGPLAEILRDAAFEIEYGDAEDRYHGQIVLAKAILGEQP